MQYFFCFICPKIISCFSFNSILASWAIKQLDANGVRYPERKEYQNRKHYSLSKNLLIFCSVHLARRVLQLERANTSLRNELDRESEQKDQLAEEVCFSWGSEGKKKGKNRMKEEKKFGKKLSYNSFICYFFHSFIVQRPCWMKLSNPIII